MRRNKETAKQCAKPYEMDKVAKDALLHVVKNYTPKLFHVVGCVYDPYLMVAVQADTAKRLYVPRSAKKWTATNLFFCNIHSMACFLAENHLRPCLQHLEQLTGKTITELTSIEGFDVGSDASRAKLAKKKDTARLTNVFLDWEANIDVYKPPVRKAGAKTAKKKTPVKKGGRKKRKTKVEDDTGDSMQTVVDEEPVGGDELENYLTGDVEHI